MRLALSTFKVPRSPAACGDVYYEYRQRRYDLQNEIKKYQECEALLRAHLIEALPVDGSSIRGQVAVVKAIPKIAVKITDWDSLHEYVRRYAAWPILLRQVNEDVIKKLWENGKEVPGTEPFEYKEVSAVKL